MATFKVVLIEHGYDTTQVERRIIEEAGGEFIDADDQPLEKALELCEEAEGIMCRRIQVTADLIGRFRNCRMLVRYGVGTDNVDVQAATKAGIMVGHIPVYAVDEVSTHALAMLLACVRRLGTTQRKVEAGGWEVHRGEPIWRVRGRTLGIVGLGNIGRDVARKMAAWGLRLLATDPYVEESVARDLNVDLVDLDTLCRESDFLTLHCPLLPETRHLINERTLALMKPEAILVNTARGPVVSQEALLTALEKNQIAQAALDVFEEEPLPSGSPVVGHKNIILTDHTAWYSEESQADLQRKAAEEVVLACTGRLPFSVANPELIIQQQKLSEWSVPEHVKWQLARLKKLKVSGV